MSLPSPYYQQDDATIYCEDCRVILPDQPEVDLVLADPPYGIGAAAENNPTRSVLAVSRDYGIDSWDDECISGPLMSAVVSGGQWAIVFGGNFYSMPASTCWLVWDKDNGKNSFADCELAWTNLKKAVRRIRYKWQGMLQEPGRPKEIRRHPTQKPVAVMRWCIRQAPADVRTILDPFMGSGTTLLAALMEGRTATGIEIEEKYCEIAANRLEAWHKGVTLKDIEQGQISLFDLGANE